MKKKSFKEIYADLEANSDEYYSEGLILDFLMELERIMRANNVTRAELARRLNSSSAYVTKVFSGSTSFTLKTLGRFARALHCDLRLHIAPADHLAHWRDEVRSRPVVICHAMATQDLPFAAWEGKPVAAANDYSCAVGRGDHESAAAVA